jgi:hypothetical protein
MNDKYKSTNPVQKLKKERLIVNKQVVIGLTYYDHDGSFIERRQMYGKVISVDINRIVVELEGSQAGKTFGLPRDLRSFHKARPGIYKLKSTDEEVVNPDYTTTWNIIKPPPD